MSDELCYRARTSILSSIRLAFIGGPPHDVAAVRAADARFAALVTEVTPLWKAYALLDSERKAAVRNGIENPALGCRVNGVDVWQSEDRAVLDRLDAGEKVD